MGVKNTIKRIRCRLSRDYCYREMSKSGHALMLCCEGKGVDVGDSGMKCVPLRCTRCPRYFEGFSVERYERDIKARRVPSIRKVDDGWPEWRCKTLGEPVKHEEGRKVMDDKDKVIAFLARLTRDLILGLNITDDELQALDNIIDELPDVDTKEFRW